MKTRGFTLIELLVSVAIIAVLASLLMTVLARTREAGKLAREISAGRQMVAAYMAASGDRDGVLMAGYSARETASDDRGNPVESPACGRYPWRLAPYMKYQMKGVMMVNEQEKILALPDHDDLVYHVSLFPSFGINATYVGGNERTGLAPTPATLRYYGDFVVTRMAQCAQPGRLILFASARYGGGSPSDDPSVTSKGEQAGFHLLNPPRTTGIDWRGPYDRRKPAEAFGFVDLRYSGRAVCVMLGGNVELLDENQIQDMRYWSAQAAEKDDPDFTVKPIQ